MISLILEVYVTDPALDDCEDIRIDKKTIKSFFIDFQDLFILLK